MSLPPNRLDRELRLGVAALGVAIVLAAIIVGVRLAMNDDQQTPLPAAPTSAPIPTLPIATMPPATPAPSPQPPLAELAADGRSVVCLDPGHGGTDQGNVRVVDGEIVLEEKDFTLDHALTLGERLRSQGIEVVFTRTTDTEMNPDNQDVNDDGTVAAEGGPADSDQLDDLQARVFFCNESGADLLVSIHYNGAENEFLQGYEVWYNDERPFSDRSARFATLMHASLAEKMQGAGYEAVDRGIGIEEHAVTGPARPGELDPSHMPGAVVEGLFLSNDDDAEFIVSDAGNEALVTAYDEAIVEYFTEYPG